MLKNTLVASILLAIACQDALSGPPSLAARPLAAHGSVSVDTYAISPSDSRIEFVDPKATGSTAGRFAKFAGVIDVVSGKPESSRVTLEIDVNSAQLDAASAGAGSASRDLFDGTRFPTAAFVSAEIRPGGAGGATHTVTGSFALRGWAKTVSFPATLEVAGDAVTASAEFSIDRKDFGLDAVSRGAQDGADPDKLRIRFSIRAPRKESTRTVVPHAVAAPARDG